MATNPQTGINRFVELVRTGKVAYKDAKHSGLWLTVGLDAANTALAVVNGGNRPAAGGQRKANVMRDGIVVDRLGAVTNVRETLTELHDKLGHIFIEAAVAIPPGVSEGTAKVLTNMLDACELGPCEVVDELVTAARAPGMTDGTIIDIDHGTTGVSRLRDGVVDFSTDEPTGGHHMTLVLSGVLGMGHDKVGAFKCDPANVETVFPAVRPTLKKIAIIAERALGDANPGKVYLVGGLASLSEAPKAFEKVLGVTVDRPEEPLFPTPLGAAMRSSQ